MSKICQELSDRFHGQSIKFRQGLFEAHRSTSWVHRDGHWFYCFDHTTWQSALDEADRMQREGKLAGAVSPCGQSVRIRDGRSKVWA